MTSALDHYKGRRIELREHHNRLRLFIDNVLVRHGRLPGNLYFLYEYAYEWRDNLIELAILYIDYLDRVAAMCQDRMEEKGGI